MLLQKLQTQQSRVTLHLFVYFVYLFLFHSSNTLRASGAMSAWHFYTPFIRGGQMG